MSREMVVLSRQQPDLAVLPELVASASGTDLKVGGPYVFDAQDRLLLHVREPVLVTVPGEVQRLLGLPIEEPVWWVELHAATDPAEAERIARHCADAFAAQHDGTVWSESGK
ncbi:hypothetical protein [Actinomadura rubrisoli]|uniref:Uncharacterized protein n=1 Tax=Actinomadura rubrisoli TaxID=2530368 RepID=A0A4R5A1U1_9ACTN|nr:hypothetical protein [Actinomadura rubrisoli]TDD65743.1 hypothetical protein E1298_41085 [Actinomadura rubrisoli]